MFCLVLATAMSLLPDAVGSAFEHLKGAFVMIDCSTGDTFQNDASACQHLAAPCSTFKIWNSAIGLETRIVTDPDAPFWKWDGISRTVVSEWNQDQTLRSAFAVSCVPAYQDLARKIGAKRMQTWLDQIPYGTRDLSAGLDVFWLPEKGRKPLLISAQEQAEALQRLLTGKIPFSQTTLTTLKDVMKYRVTEKGTLYGKTGTGRNDDGTSNTAWFVGFVEARNHTYAFACRLEGPGLMGKDARTTVEKILGSADLL